MHQKSISVQRVSGTNSWLHYLLRLLINVRSSFKEQQSPEAALTQLKTSDFCNLRSIFNVDVFKCFFSQKKIPQPANIRSHTAVFGAKSNFLKGTVSRVGMRSSAH